ncbi:MAG: glycosyltransferase family 4 protein [Candidatus Omnitrophica bacterium]|nr:glycosyltransferase family 4 protein [Candidatus Omnitrophota bacterium]
MARWKSVNWTRYHQIFSALAKNGHRVYVIQPPPQFSQETSFQEIEVEIPQNLFLQEVKVNPFIWKSRIPLNKLFKKGYYSYKCVSEVRRFIKDYDIDVIFLYNIPQLPLIDIKGCLKIFDIADDYPAMLKQELGIFSNPVLIKLGEYILREMIEKSDLTLVVSRVLAEKIVSTNSDKIHILPNGVDLDPSRIGSGKDIRAQYKKPIIGFIGSFEYFIDFELMLEAARRLPDYTFLLVGTGRDFVEVKRLIGKLNLRNVVLTGGVAHSEIYKYIDAMDICLNIFRPISISHGACPIKLFEYLSMKKPVISTRLKELEYIDEDFLFYADNIKEVIEQIHYIIENSSLLTVRLEKGYSIVQSKYSWQVIVANFLRLIESKLN